MKFIDQAKIDVIAGSGGDGLVSWRREKYLPNGGPDGGNGGDGGAVVLRTNEGINTLLTLSFNPRIVANSGNPGGDNCQTGAKGKDAICDVPVGTQVFYGDRLVADLDQPDSRWVAARGGRGGRGNQSYKSASCQAPDYARPGEAGEAFRFRLVLKSVADVGLVGLPNAGKSTLVSRLSAAKPKAAEYPFTTLQPTLGVVSVNEEQNFVIADIPGLIPGAHEGKGLGIQFLRHIERTSVLAHLLDASSVEDTVEDTVEETTVQDRQAKVIANFEAIENELESFSEKLKLKPRLVIFSKAELPLVKEVFESCRKYFESRSITCLLISSFSGQGLPELSKSLLELIEQDESEKLQAVNV